MPYIFAENPPAINNYHGVSIFHTYKNDSVDSGVREYWFTTDPFGSEVGEDAFDVREIAGYDPTLPVAKNLTRMIDAGVFIQNEDIICTSGETEQGAAGNDGDQPDICPVCGCSLIETDSFTGEAKNLDDSRGYKFCCSNCGASGWEWHLLKFDGYEIL